MSLASLLRRFDEALIRICAVGDIRLSRLYPRIHLGQLKTSRTGPLGEQAFLWSQSSDTQCRELHPGGGQPQ